MSPCPRPVRRDVVEIPARNGPAGLATLRAGARYGPARPERSANIARAGSCSLHNHHSEKMARVIGREGIDANRATTRQIVVYDLVRERNQQPVTAVRTFDLRGFANPCAPLICTSRRVARLAGLALPPNWISVDSTLEQPAKNAIFSSVFNREGSSGGGAASGGVALIP